MEEIPALILLGEVAGTRQDGSGSTAWLRSLASELDEAYGPERLGHFDLSESGVLGGRITGTADPLVAVLHGALGSGSRPMRWICVRSCPDGLDGETGDAGLPGSAAAFEALKAARAAHEMLVLRTGRSDTDRLLADMTPALTGMLGDLTARQRAVARMALLEGLRQSEVAQRLGVRRATISVSFARARIQSLAALVSAIRRVFSSAGSATVEVAPNAASVAAATVAPIAPIAPPS
jgi:hypothetical protein